MPLFLLILGFCTFIAAWLSFYPDKEVGDSWTMRFTFFLALMASAIGGAMCVGKIMANAPDLGRLFTNDFGPVSWWTGVLVLAIGLMAWTLYRRIALAKQPEAQSAQ